MNRPSTRLKMCAFVVALAGIGAGCNGDSSGNGGGSGSGNVDGTRESVAPDGDDPFGWIDFGDDDRVQTGSLEVPIDYSDPSKGTFDLFVARHLAEPSQRIGSLLVNPGGPGFGGSDFAVYAEQVYG
ncbi:MAG: hypothetical protein Q7V62_14885, partial [Actinomycetota bacterium]|nr:hypothetical protein [Actinomycetota bacterium]